MVCLRSGVEQGGAEPIDSPRACAERQGADQLTVLKSSRLHLEKPNNGFSTQIHPLLKEIAEAFMEQLPALLRELFWLPAREELMEHWVQPFCHGADQADQGFSIDWIKLLPTGCAPQGVVTTPLPELHPVGELLLETHLLAGQDHGLTAIEIQSLDGQQQQIETLDAPSAETCASPENA